MLLALSLKLCHHDKHQTQKHYEYRQNGDPIVRKLVTLQIVFDFKDLKGRLNNLKYRFYLQSHHIIRTGIWDTQTNIWTDLTIFGSQLKIDVFLIKLLETVSDMKLMEFSSRISIDHRVDEWREIQMTINGMRFVNNIVLHEYFLWIKQIKKIKDYEN